MLFSELDFIIKNSEGLNKWTDFGCFEQTGKIIVRELCAYVLNEKTHKVSGLFRIIENQQFEHLQTARVLTSLSVCLRDLTHSSLCSFPILPIHRAPHPPRSAVIVLAFLLLWYSVMTESHLKEACFGLWLQRDWVHHGWESNLVAGSGSWLDHTHKQEVERENGQWIEFINPRGQSTRNILSPARFCFLKMPSSKSLDRTTNWRSSV